MPHSLLHGENISEQALVSVLREVAEFICFNSRSKCNTKEETVSFFSFFQETYFNEKEFPRSFTKGSYEGFWWAFVTMTTVG